ncbi:DUF2268 domain-containing protein [Lysinibacillus sphaericus]|uniref:DUF2268 domain-containing protein n=1 Tax=Lysinibacillus sphaericus TaxID=1421 RepID=UPI0018CEA866|nr:DUF2268 domain-containing putative Zn-dependent protease [Lysinibacillus sphaericus]MBG9757822.1 hypothetical protein [Lysinibacillus sphaericus]MEB7454861.1 DUF2268 domain-containing putative Zn-dependent protease [Lysinibacillus sphaericus]QTB13441.1 hypothetical protein J2B92_22340 [Lysinibacillus sphaericus]
MAVMPTDKWLEEYEFSRKSKSSDELYSLQCSVLCDRLIKLFQEGYTEEIHFELQQQGLFLPEEEINLKRLKQMNVWGCVEQEFMYLQQKWNGPAIPIYIFPITRQQNITNKNGVAYPHSLFLFVGEVEKQELQALLAHEYNHVCRLHYLKKSLDEMTLLDSLILEGLAECAVKDLYGDRWLAPWLTNFTFEKLIKLWKSQFLPNLQLQGLEKHRPFLYGGELPLWIGYCIGYQIVRSYMKNLSSQLPLLITSQDILAGSEFPLQ